MKVALTEFCDVPLAPVITGADKRAALTVTTKVVDPTVAVYVPAAAPVLSATVNVPEAPFRVIVAESALLKEVLLKAIFEPAVNVQLPDPTEIVVVGAAPESPARVNEIVDVGESVYPTVLESVVRDAVADVIE